MFNIFNSSFQETYKKYSGWIIIILSISWGLVLRSINLDAPSFWIDEAFSVEIAQQLLGGSSSSFFSDDFWLRGIIHHQLLAGIINNVGESEASMRWPSVVAGVILAITIVWFCLRNFGLKAAATAAVLMSLGYWQIAWSRQAREYILLSLVFWLGMFAIQKLWSASIAKWLKVGIIAAVTLVSLGVHWFGLGLVAGVYFKWLAEKLINSDKSQRLYLLVVTAFGVIFIVYIFRAYFDINKYWINTYSSFLINAYWPLLITSFIALFAVRDKKQREILLWVGLTCLFIYVIIVMAVPTVNMRYVFFITPVFVIFSAVTVQYLFTYQQTLFISMSLFSLLIITLAKTIAWMPTSDYMLEHQKGNDSFEYYTPQPDYKSAYQFINNELDHINLVTPYPAMSRRYRDIDDVLSFDPGVKLMHQTREQSSYEQYTHIPFATVTKLKQVVPEYKTLYFLVDDMFLQGIDPKIRQKIYRPQRLVKQWVNPPYSSLYLYRVK